MANGFYVTNTTAQAMATAIETAIDAGTAAVIEIYAGTVPADADATPSSPTLLASLTCSGTFGTVSTGVAGTGTGLITAGSITSDTSADNTGTAAYFRIKTQTGGTAVCQGTVGVSSADLILNTVSITAGSTVAVTSATITVPEGP
jgi:hypothetical protein